MACKICRKKLGGPGGGLSKLGKNTVHTDCLKRHELSRVFFQNIKDRIENDIFRPDSITESEFDQRMTSNTSRSELALLAQKQTMIMRLQGLLDSPQAVLSFSICGARKKIESVIYQYLYEGFAEIISTNIDFMDPAEQQIVLILAGFPVPDDFYNYKNAFFLHPYDRGSWDFQANVRQAKGKTY